MSVSNRTLPPPALIRTNGRSSCEPRFVLSPTSALSTAGRRAAAQIPSTRPNIACSIEKVPQPTMLGISSIGRPPPNTAAVIGSVITLMNTMIASPNTTPAPTSGAALSKRSARAAAKKTAPQNAPTSCGSPRRGAPAQRRV